MKFSAILATALLLAALAIPAAALEPNTSCQALEAWASQLQRLPTDYESFSQLTMAERKAVYDRLSSADRAALWNHHWQEALRAGDWTQKQKALIEEAGGLMKEQTFAALEPRQGPLHDSARAAVAISKPASRKPSPSPWRPRFSTGSERPRPPRPKPRASSPTAIAPPAGRSAKSAFAGQADVHSGTPVAASSTMRPVRDSATFGVCRKKRRAPFLLVSSRGFRVGGEDCDAGLRCEPGGCQPRPTGCGIFYEDNCDGQCRHI